MPVTVAGSWPEKAAIFGATGGIGAALCRALADGGCSVIAFSRSGEAPKHSAIRAFRFDLDDEASISKAIADADLADAPPDLVVVATGILTLEDGKGPERSFKAIDPCAMAKVFQLNTIGPALIARHVLPLMPREKRWVFSAISAKVGSISENELGGWHSYRASKAALNMLIKNFAIEMKRTHPQGVVAALHPGTVDTELSKPFQANLPPGQLATRRDAACNLLEVLSKLQPDDSGHFFSWDEQQITP